MCKCITRWKVNGSRESLPFDPACVHLTQSRLQVDEQNITKKEGDLTHGWEWDHGRDEHAG
jgi:hypothetical protein